MNKMKPGLWRPIATAVVLAATLAALVNYFVNHPEVGQQLERTSVPLLALLLLLYLFTFVALAVVTAATLRLCNINLGKSENFLLMGYTAVINFFGPLQSGPAFRAIYLKAKHGLELKKYAGATLIYYFLWAVFSTLMLLSGLLGWWLVGLVLAIIVGAKLTSRHSYIRTKLPAMNARGWVYLALATLLQISIITLIYYSELRSIAPGTDLSQAIIFTGAANLSLFVSITPAGIGFRESFLLFSQNLHDVSSSTIVAASILDRAIYVLALALLAILIFSTHASRKFEKYKNSV